MPAGQPGTVAYQELLAQRRKRRYLRVLKDGALRINRAAVRAEARYDGKHVLRTNTELAGDEVAQSYRSLIRVEQSFHSQRFGVLPKISMVQWW